MRDPDGDPDRGGDAVVNGEAGGLTIDVGDDQSGVSMNGGGAWTLPVGPRSLVEGPLGRAERPSPAQLTNALGLVEDHFDDVILAAPIVASAPSVVFRGRHARGLAAVELGTDDVPGDYVLDRSDADDVFRTLVAETVDERRHNPGIDPAQVETIVGTCCVVLAVMRRLDLPHAMIRPDDRPASVSSPASD